MAFNGNTVAEKSLGGSETAAYYVALELKNLGHKVTVFTNEKNTGKFDGVTYLCMGDKTEQTPLGDEFHFYATCTPHDVLIIQRHPLAFNFKWASKSNYLWLHDVPNKDQVKLFNSQMWNIDGVLTVSEYHKNTIVDAYKINPDFVHSIENGVDASLYLRENQKDEDSTVLNKSDFNLIYSSRPERGLEHLVAPGGIMDQLLTLKTNHHLYVCAYDNVVPQMQEYYGFLDQCIERLPNVTNMGALNKTQLANLQLNCDLAVYPTEFEEVSCITAMECMHAGLPLLTSKHAALVETCRGSGTTLIDLKKGKLVLSKFVNYLKTVTKGGLSIARKNQIKASEFKTWGDVGHKLDEVVNFNFNKVSIESKAKQLMRTGDIYALKYLLDETHTPDNEVMNSIKKEMGLYNFAFDNDFNEHYKNYYQYEKERGVNYGPESLDGNSRFEVVSQKIKELYEQAGILEKTLTVLDYGCAHGHYTINLAKRFPNINFIGVDIAQSNIDKAVDWALNDNVGNVDFICGSINVETGIVESVNQPDAVIQLLQTYMVDVVIAAEVIEHVALPAKHIEILNEHLSISGTMIITTPYGAWEYISAHEHYPWRAHIHHFEIDDLKDMLPKFKNLKISAIPDGQDQFGEVLGSYITTFTKCKANEFKEINYSRKINNTKGRDTLSVCMIVKDAEESLLKTLNSIEGVADEIIIGIDAASTDSTNIIIDSFADKNPLIAFTVFQIPKAVETGFAVARNATIEKAVGDWVMWIDSDEILDQPQLLAKYLRNNQHDGYAVAQHHFAIQPLGVLKTDFPTRLFRNSKGVTFSGIVHEHPEINQNEGVPFCSKAEGFSIAHMGYQNEEVRRKRFERNFPLMVRDRKENPNRLLGKFLWIRDMSQLCMFELEQTGKVSERIAQYANEGISLWRELLKDNHLRLVIDSLDFVSQLNRVVGLNTGFEFKFAFDVGKDNQADLNRVRTVTGFFNEKRDVEKLLTVLMKDRIGVI